MSKKETRKQDKEFYQSLFKALGGTIIVTGVIILWAFFEDISMWFYEKIVPNMEKGGLLMFAILFIFPIACVGFYYMLVGGIRAYQIAAPAPEEK